MGHQNRLGSSARKELTTCEEFVCNGAQSVDVGPMVDLRVRSSLLWSHVGWCTQCHTHRGELIGSGGVTDRLRHAKIRHQCMTSPEKNVLRLDVPMNESEGMGLREGIGHISENSNGLSNGELTLSDQPFPERTALYIRHDVEKEAVCLS